MLILGVDPGLASTGVGVIEEVDATTWKCLGYQYVTTSEKRPLPERLEQIHALVARTLECYRPQAVAVESIFFARNVRSAVMMAHGRGAAILAATGREVPVFEYSPLEIKQSVVGKGRAGKEQVRHMVQVLLGLATMPASDHESDALACALCHAFRRRQEERLRTLAAQAASGGTDNDYERRKELLAQARRGRRRGRR